MTTKVCSCSVIDEFFSSIFCLWLVEPTDVKPIDMQDRVPYNKGCGQGLVEYPGRGLMSLWDYKYHFPKKFVPNLSLEGLAVISWVDVGLKSFHTGNTVSQGLETQTGVATS